MKIKEVNKKKYMNILSKSLVFLFLAALSILPASAELTGGAVGPLDPVTQFPQWYSDQTGLQLQPCLAQTGFVGPVDPLCGLLAVPGVFDPALPIAFPGPNFPDEFFYHGADSAIVSGTPDDPPIPPAVATGIDVILVTGLEGNFGAPGDQTVFGRVRIRMDVPAPGTYTVTHPYGTQVFDVPAVVFGSPEIFDTSDIGCIGAPIGPQQAPLCSFSIAGQPGFANLFGLALFSNIGPRFLTWDTFGQAPPIGPPVGYIGDPGTEHAVTGGLPGQNLFRITGPAGVDLNATEPGIQNTIETNLFTVVGKILAINRFNISGFKIDDPNANGVADPGELGIANWTISLTNNVGTVVNTTVTGANGFYNFANIGAGTYTLMEETRAGFIPTNATSKAINLNANLINQNFTNMNVTGRAAITNVTVTGVGSRGAQINVLVNLSSQLAVTRTFVVVVSGVAADGSPLVGSSTVVLAPNTPVNNSPVIVAVPPSATPGTYNLIAAIFPIETFQTSPQIMAFPARQATVV